jgi:hypothetical protein
MDEALYFELDEQDEARAARLYCESLCFYGLVAAADALLTELD